MINESSTENADEYGVDNNDNMHALFEGKSRR